MGISSRLNFIFQPSYEMGFIDKQGLIRIQKHKYVSGTYTYIDNAMQPWWNFVEEWIPMSVAPNMVTLWALIINISGVLLYLSHDFTQSQPMPIWYHFYASMCLFVY